MRTVAELHTGEKAEISGFKESDLLIQFLEMGCIPGSEIELCCTAPLGSPLCIRVCGYHLALRKEEAANILIK